MCDDVVERDGIIRRPFIERAFGPLGKGSLRGCIISLVFSALGAGILSLPWAMAKLGLIVGMCVILASAMFSYATMEMLIVSGKIRGHCDYADTMADILGPPGAVLVNVIVAVDSAGAICVFYKYMAGSVQMLSASVGYDIPLSVLIVIMSFGIVFPLSLPRRITAMQYVTMASIVPLAMVTGVIVAQCPRHSSWTRVESMLWPADLLSIEAAQACSAIFFSFMCHMNLWAVCNELTDAVPCRTSKLFRRVVLILFVVYGTVAIAGAVSFGNATPANVLEAYPADDVANVIAHLLMSVMLIVCSVLCVHPVRHALASLFGYSTTKPDSRPGTPALMLAPSMMPDSPTPNCINSMQQPLLQNQGADKAGHVSTFCHFLLTFAVVAGTSTVAILVPRIVELLGVLGGFCGVILMFVLPTFMYARTKPGMRAAISIVVATCFCIVGLPAAIGSVTI